MFTGTEESIATGTTGYTCSVAALTCLSWDIITSLADEVQLLWEKPNGWFRWLYIFIRYFPLAVEATLTGLFAHTGLQTHRPWRICDIEVTVEGVLLELVILSVQVILLVRVYILYNRRKVVLVVLLALLAASVGAMAFSMNMASGRFEYDGHCLVTASPKVMLVVWLSPTVFEAVLFAMTIAKFKQSRGEGLGRRPILDTIVRDGTWALIFAAVMVLNTLVYTSAARNALSGAAYLYVLLRATPLNPTLRIDDKLDIVGLVSDYR